MPCRTIANKHVQKPSQDMRGEMRHAWNSVPHLDLAIDDYYQIHMDASQEEMISFPMDFELNIEGNKELEIDSFNKGLTTSTNEVCQQNMNIDLLHLF